MGLKRRGVSSNLVLASDFIKVLICQQYYYHNSYSYLAIYISGSLSERTL